MNSPSKVDYRHGIDFTDPETRITVRINYRELPQVSSNSIPLRHYSFEMGVLRYNEAAREDRLIRHFPVLVSAQNGKAEIQRRFPTHIMNQLIAEAEEWIHTQCQSRQDEIISARIDREKAHISKGPAKPLGLKELAKRDKLRKEAGR